MLGSMALVAAVDRAVAEVEARTSGRFQASWHVPDSSVSTEGFDLESWDDLCKRSRPAAPDAAAAEPQGTADAPTDLAGQRRLHLLALRDSHTHREGMAGYAKIKLLNQHTLAPRAAADLLAALSAAEGGGSSSVAAARLCGGVGYLGCVVVRPLSMCAHTKLALLPRLGSDRQRSFVHVN
jgi:hypothetical protein